MTNTIKLSKECFYMKTYEYKLTATKVAECTTKVANSNDSASFLRPLFKHYMELQECFYVLFLDRQNKIKGYTELSRGGIDGTVVDIKLIMKYAIDSLACSIILAHNHPSGNLKESVPDRNLTQKVKEACRVMDITLLDHIIITADSYKSFADEGIL